MEWVRKWQQDWESQQIVNLGPLGSLSVESQPRSSPQYLFDYLRFGWKEFKEYRTLKDSYQSFEQWLYSWIQNFDSVDDQRAAFVMASRIYFLSSEEYDYLVKFVYAKIKETQLKPPEKEHLLVDLGCGSSA